jgi:hypothetical protein
MWKAFPFRSTAPLGDEVHSNVSLYRHWREGVEREERKRKKRERGRE